jgi:hypothetical protein
MHERHQCDFDGSVTRMGQTNMIIILKNHSVIEAAAILCVIIFFSMSIFQLLLVFGAPFGKLAWGGKYKILPLSLRIGSFISALIFVFGGIIMLEKVNLISVLNSPVFVSILIWFFAILFGLSSLGNIMSKSRLEKRIMTPVALIIFFLCLIIAIGD